ncbi:MAG: FAD-dependent oxidoreductase [Bacillota bacterium]
MTRIGVIGGGIAGSTVAVELAEAGFEVVLFEKTDKIGGQISEFGCKATDICTRCNLCLVDSVFNQLHQDSRIKINKNHQVIDSYKENDGFTLYCEEDGVEKTYKDFDKIVLATGYRRWSELETGTPEIFADQRIIWSGQFEEMLFKRRDYLQDKDLELDLDFKPESAYFIQCNGSRSPQEKASYCSRVCCGYNYRIARVLRETYPEMEIGIFFIDMQEAGFLTDLSFQKLIDEEIEYFNCKPLRINRKDDRIEVAYEDQELGKMKKVKTDLLVLSEGIHPGKENELWSKLFNLQLDSDGFLKEINPGRATGVYLAGTISGPGDIATTISKSKAVANEIISVEKEVVS